MLGRYPPTFSPLLMADTIDHGQKQPRPFLKTVLWTATVSQAWLGE